MFIVCIMCMNFCNTFKITTIESNKFLRGVEFLIKAIFLTIVKQLNRKDGFEFFRMQIFSMVTFTSPEKYHGAIKLFMPLFITNTQHPGATVKD